MVKKRLSPTRMIVIGFAAVIIIGTLLLLLPISHKNGVNVSFIDALFTSTSAVCVTGLLVVDSADTFSTFGQIVLAILIQVGGLGITSLGVGLITLAGKKVNVRERLLVKEALNYPTFSGVVGLIRSVMIVTFSIEFIGMLLSFIVFSQDYPFFKALGISAFHSIASFNNAGFDILGGMTSLTLYADDVLLNITTCMLIISGGIGFFAITDVLTKRSFKKFSLQTKLVLIVTVTLLLLGTLLLKLTNSDMTWLESFFLSTSARTAGFSTYQMSKLTNAGLIITILLMIIGASPGSTGGGIKTTTAFVILKSLLSTSTNKQPIAFRKRIPRETIDKAFFVAIFALILITLVSFLLCILEPSIRFSDAVFEAASAFATVGLSTGITPALSPLSKILVIITMFIGRLGPLTMATIWVYNPKRDISYPPGTIAVG
ncbi:MAG: H(+)-transporting ATPase [Clostridia bacterium]|nr:H(+)-transporting ATPase [Clostridia bacterium]